MKQARWWLLLAAATLAVPTEAFAQNKKAPAAPAGKPAPAAGAPAAGAAAGGVVDLDAPGPATGAPAGTNGAAAGGAIDLDGPQPNNGAGAGTGGTDTGTGSICDIDPNAPACGKSTDPAKSPALRVLKPDVYAVQQIYALRKNRLELNPYWGFSLNDQFVSHPGPGLAVNYYITNVLAVGVNGNYYGSFNSDSEFNFQNRRATRLAVPLTEYLAGGNLNFTYVPVYGKFSGFSNFIFHFDTYVVGGIGAIWTKPIAVIDPDNRKFEQKMKLDFNAGLGLRVFFNRWFAVNLEIRDYIYNEQLEATTISKKSSDPKYASAPERDPSTWYGQNSLTNNVQAQIGVSLFLPPSWEYRLPK